MRWRNHFMHDAICFVRNLHVRACTAAHIHACGLSCEVSHRTIQSGNSFGNSSGIVYISRNRFGNCRDCNSRTMRMRYRYRCRCRCRIQNYITIRAPCQIQYHHVGFSDATWQSGISMSSEEIEHIWDRPMRRSFPMFHHQRVDNEGYRGTNLLL